MANFAAYFPQMQIEKAAAAEQRTETNLFRQTRPHRNENNYNRLHPDFASSLLFKPRSGT
jgi:hypothetical protein